MPHAVRLPDGTHVLADSPGHARQLAPMFDGTPVSAPRVLDLLDSHLFAARVADWYFHKPAQDDYVHGAEWYHYAHMLARRLARDTGRSVETICGVLAALSPQVAWPTCCDMSRKLANDPEIASIGHFGNATDKAKRILAGALPLDVLGGPKVRAFYRCLASGGADPYAVCVDRHAAAIALGSHDLSLIDRALGCAGGYDAIADSYREVAESARIVPSTVQAVSWVAYRRLERNRKEH